MPPPGELPKRSPQSLLPQGQLSKRPLQSTSPPGELPRRALQPEMTVLDFEPHSAPVVTVGHCCRRRCHLSVRLWRIEALTIDVLVSTIPTAAHSP
jgi:hypothetical protein